jgi:hypothetical protein
MILVTFPDEAQHHTPCYLYQSQHHSPEMPPKSSGRLFDHVAFQSLKAIQNADQELFD